MLLKFFENIIIDDYVTLQPMYYSCLTILFVFFTFGVLFFNTASSSDLGYPSHLCGIILGNSMPTTLTKIQ